ncbi:MAG: D-alanyl-D-alanine carboxypeptidase/D-alanyl-D-alanine-endopeptidase [Gaiellaceae bacterium MAG52_C11]|nr:D-alanyl-D-alanine carboxypeptidase/D-alanyl-D-alanine-endopeptidase [Candidatus Gaiellasilicea maunaloa]
MRGPSLLLVLVAAAFTFSLASAPPGRAADPTLPSRLARALAVPNVDPSRTAALAIDLRSGTVVYSRNPLLSLQPASNEKLPIAYAALTLLGSNHRFHTEVVGTGSLVGDVWHGNLFLRGFGDPTLEPADLDALAADVASWGIARVDGAVIGDESWFDAQRTAPGWKPSFYIGQSPPLSALVVDRGWFRGRTAREPALAAASLFRRALASKGVAVRRSARAGTLTTSGFPLAQDLSEPLTEIVRFMGRESDNFTAEVLLKQLGALYADDGSTAAGARVVEDALAAAKIPLGGVRIADGSGLSRLDRLTASAVVALLLAGIADPAIRDAFLGSLAVAGVDGTLRSRLESRPARGRVIAKTGTTSVASALSGFVRERFVFAILQNGAPVSSYWARRAQDRFATVLAAS